MTGVPGLNDLLGPGHRAGTCSTVPNTPNVGGHSVHRMFDIGTADPPQCSPDLVLITLQNKVTGAVRQTCDLGRATGTGKWADIGKFRAPPLRGLAARAPYFHDGQAKDIRAAVNYHDQRFNIGLNAIEKLELEYFLMPCKGQSVRHRPVRAGRCFFLARTCRLGNGPVNSRAPGRPGRRVLTMLAQAPECAGRRAHGFEASDSRPAGSDAGGIRSRDSARDGQGGHRAPSP
jgi:hypothetical protein